ALATAGPYIALALALLIMAPHLVWLVRNDFLPFAYASARAAPSRGILDHVLHPLVFALGQLAFLLPALAIAAAVIWPQPKGEDAAMPGAAKADAFDRRIVTLLAFGPAATTVALSALTGRGAIAMWGYPLWLFLGLWIVLYARAAIEPVRLGRIVGVWAGVFALFAIAFAASYSVLPAIDHRYRAVFYPGDRLADELARRFRAATGRPLTYVIGTMWDGGNVAHYAREQPRVLIDGDWRGEVDAGGEPDAADVEHVGQAFERHRRLGPDRFELVRALEQVFLAVEVERGEPGGASKRMRRIGVAVKQLRHVHRPAHEGVVN